MHKTGKNSIDKAVEKREPSKHVKRRSRGSRDARHSKGKKNPKFFKIYPWNHAKKKHSLFVFNTQWIFFHFFHPKCRNFHRFKFQTWQFHSLKTENFYNFSFQTLKSFYFWNQIYTHVIWKLNFFNNSRIWIFISFQRMKDRKPGKVFILIVISKRSTHCGDFWWPQGDSLWKPLGRLIECTLFTHPSNVRVE